MIIYRGNKVSIGGLDSYKYDSQWLSPVLFSDKSVPVPTGEVLSESAREGWLRVVELVVLGNAVITYCTSEYVSHVGVSGHFVIY